MANPRKFSEKIALHNQKQAEETAAFEAIIKEVTSATRGQAYPRQHLPISQNLGAYRGGSLPNVNQIGPGIDLQTALQHLEDIRQPDTKQARSNLVERIHRERSRQIGPHRRALPVDKRTDCSPYGSAYLSPPPDTSWRRTNSDSALHTSAMAPSMNNHHLTSPSTPPTHRRIAEMVGENVAAQDSLNMKSYWDPKKLVQSRPKSCEVPNINIYPSPQSEQESNNIHIPISNNTGSLPDLTVLHFPSPLATPLDVDGDQSYVTGTSPVNLSPTNAHHMNMGSPQHASPQSPVQRRRHVQAVPSPLVLNNANQMQIPLSPPVSTVDPSNLCVDPRIRQQYLLYLQQRQRANNGQAPRHRSQPRLSIFNNVHHTMSPVQMSASCEQVQQTQASMSQYRNSVSDSNCQSPTSPLSQPSYSPSQSPGLSSTSMNNNSPFAEAYFIQQQQQTNALQHQFEQFNMDNPPNSTIDSMTNCSTTYSNTHPSLNFSQAVLHSLTGSLDYQGQQLFHGIDLNNLQQQQQGMPMNQTPTSPHHSQTLHGQQLSPSANNKIPDIVLTGADDNLGRPPPDFAKDLGNAITGMADGFDTDFFSTDEAFKAGLDPLDLDGLQMLTDPNMVTDPATEDTFKLDRL
ncbi:CREB-regulated transcription coactivator 1-like isoform X2 [Gigantopelta aegis]|uniref:CREB-regulated transcription coactivator 1-like isoform X2 n=1 Tax=Gigantopelta aegis TaxID=1735272 RepID=UPI001B887F8A|nr:CREB-regulated transcription coactivator 1-like isoform X2 [Gigantopelta aegis]